MKRLRKVFGILLVISVLAMFMTTTVLADKPVTYDANGNEIGWQGTGCATIQSGTITDANNVVITVGFDQYGYNYQAHLFSGSYVNVYFRADGFPPYMGDDVAYLAAWPDAANHWAWDYRTTNVLMKWNDAWLSNTDCNDDGKLDRHYGFDSYIGSGAWETNHQWGSYLDGGKEYTWDYFSKIVAAPLDATLIGGIWYNADHTVFGPAIWGEFATIQEVYNDTGTGEHGLLYKSNPGLGH